MKLVVMIPAFNEEKTISQVIKEIPRKINGITIVEVLVVNDGSKDNTIEQARKAKADKIISNQLNSGLGVTFRKGIDTALEMNADVIVNIDADMQFNPQDIPKLIKPILDSKADMVTASRFACKALEPEMPGIKKFGNHLFTGIINLLTGQHFTDTQCGFRAYSKEAALRLTLFGKFTYTQEVFLDLSLKGLKIVEVPLKVKGERIGQSRIVKSWYSYGLKALTIIIRSMRDYKPLKFFGGIGLIVFLIGFITALFLFVNWLLTGHTSPFGTLILISVFFMMFGFLLVVLALLADMLDRQRKIQEEILYRLKKK
ncbi:MAG: glycosyltransferase family 2 protein [archaeon]